MDKTMILNWIDKNKGPFEQLALEIWAKPEIAYEEAEAVRLQMAFMKERGFTVTQKAGLPTAFVAEWGNGGPVLGILGEYDALAGLSQTVSPQIEPVQKGAAGHGCGHNLLGVGGLLAACAVKEVFTSQNIKGTVRYFGCPAEEQLTGKGKMAQLGYFEGTDISLAWHPGDYSSVTDATLTALASAKFRFKGRSSHAGGAPEAGRSALDAVELMNVGANYLREHMLDQDRLHYTITNGGLAPNIVPADAEVWYFLRSPHDAELAELWKRLLKVAKGAAMMTETEVTYELLGGCYNTLPNQVLNKVLEENLISFAGPLQFDSKESEFAKEIQASVSRPLVDASYRRLASRKTGEDVLAATPLPCFDHGGMIMGSTDVGDVANLMPTSLFWAMTYPIGVPAHTWQSTACSGSSLGLKGTIQAAKTLAGAIYDLTLNADLIREAKEEFTARRAGKSYKPIEELLKTTEA